MAEPERPATQLAATFPSPPPFFQHFNVENLEKINELRVAQKASTGDQSDQSSPKTPTRLLNLPPELLFLQPPLPPSTGIYRVFGDSYTLKEILPPLSAQNIEQLYDTPPTTPSGSESPDHLNLILHKLIKSNFLNFLELIGILGHNVDMVFKPSKQTILNIEITDAVLQKIDEKTKDLRTHVVNIHHVLNMYRPHQARESLLMQMEDHVERANKEIEAIYAAKKRVEDEFERISKLEIPEMDGLVKKEAVRKVEDDNEGTFEAWEELTKQFG